MRPQFPTHRDKPPATSAPQRTSHDGRQASQVPATFAQHGGHAPVRWSSTSGMPSPVTDVGPPPPPGHMPLPTAGHPYPSGLRSGSPPLACYRSFNDPSAPPTRPTLTPMMPMGLGLTGALRRPASPSSDVAPSLGPSSDVPSAHDLADLDSEAVLRMTPFQVTQQMMDMRLALLGYKGEVELLKRLCQEQEHTVHRLRAWQSGKGVPASEDHDLSMETEMIHVKGQLAMALASETHYKKQCEELLALAQGIVRANVQISCEVMHYKQQLKAAGLPVTELDSKGPQPQRQSKGTQPPSSGDRKSVV